MQIRLSENIRALRRRRRQHRAGDQQRQTQRQKPFVRFHDLPPEGVTMRAVDAHAGFRNHATLYQPLRAKATLYGISRPGDAWTFCQVFRQAAFAQFPPRGVLG